MNSEFLKAECRKLFHVEAIVERMGGLANASAQPRTRRAGEFRMLSVSRIEASKRIDWLLEALATLETAPARPLSETLDWRLDIVGKGPMRAPLEAMSRELGLARRVHFHGFVADAALDDLYATADLFLMPAVQGYGIPAIEALTRRIPILLHRDSGVSDLLLATPWATVFDGPRAATASALATAIDNAARGIAATAPLPQLPTEELWAENVARACGYIL